MKELHDPLLQDDEAVEPLLRQQHETLEKCPTQRNGDNDQLLMQHGEYYDKSLRDVPTTDYARAGFVNKVFMYWLGALLEKGTRTSLVKDDVPGLVPEDRAAKLYEDFIANWPQKQEPKSVQRTLIRTFWKPFAEVGLLALLRLSVLFVGPVLINSFVQVTSGNARFKYEGYVLVVALFLAKSIEVIAQHQYGFLCYRLGMKIRSSLISAVYRKGLGISSHARQSHGVGQIVNYMSTDVMQLNDLVIQLHNVWIVPAQIIVAMAILINVVGFFGSLAGLIVVSFTSALTIWGGKKLRSYQVEIMKGRDSRMRYTVEAISNMKIIKLQAWDERFQTNVENARLEEYGALSGYMYILAFNIFTLWLTPLACNVAIFTCFVLMGGGLTASTAFTTIATVQILQEPLRLFPNTLIAFSQAVITLGRLEKFMWSDELKRSSVERMAYTKDVAISVTEGSFRWNDESQTPTLQNINLHVKPGSLVAVVGKVGAGKSSLLNSLLGEMTKVSGEVKVCGTTAYVSQQAWIQNATIEENILFGRPMNRVSYQKAIQQCALVTDLGQMDFGDQTEIGERGINLSGGQKQRVQLARAVYQDCDIYLLDDVFSAVDAHTGAELFRECILGGLRGKTVFLVTHQIDFLPAADQILVMRDGRIVQSGKYEDLLTVGTDLEALVDASNEAMDIVHTQDSAAEELIDEMNVAEETPKSPTIADGEEFCLSPCSPIASPAGSRRPSDALDRRSFGRSLSRKLSAEEVRAEKTKREARLIQEEERATGRVGGAVYWMYCTRTYGGLLFFLLVLLQFIWQMFQLLADYWVAYGASDGELDRNETRRFLSVYAFLALSCGFFHMIRSATMAFMGLTTTQSFYLGMLRSIFQAPMAFFDTTPTGRILSRASTDQASIDILVPQIGASVLALVFQTIAILLVTVATTWQICSLLIPTAYLYYRYQGYYLASSRELARVDALTKAPLVQHFSETVSGFVTIRCFGQRRRFIQMNVDRIDSNLRMYFHSQAAVEWVGFRMGLIGNVILCASSLILVTVPLGFIKPELVGLNLTYGLNLSSSLFVACWMFCLLENAMVSVERIGQFTKLQSEAELEIEETKPAPEWPVSGTIVMNNLKLRYRPNTPLVLKGITLAIEGGQKVGVVGRTGSGKSTLILALFRIVEAAEGRIIIDDIDISTLGLNDLRSRLSIIPQDPTLFNGTVRSNLDPLGKHTDDEIWEVLEKCQLNVTVRELVNKLDSPVLENGENWSLGQRQLFCLGRVLLKRSRILVLDEATASVDTQTDAVMQKIIRKEFENSTVISIAHRIPTVMDSEKVLVLDAGKLQEYGTPSSLLDDSHSHFSSLVREYRTRSLVA